MEEDIVDYYDSSSDEILPSGEGLCWSPLFAPSEVGLFHVFWSNYLEALLPGFFKLSA